VCIAFLKELASQDFDFGVPGSWGSMTTLLYRCIDRNASHFDIVKVEGVHPAHSGYLNF
jgi:hypothetical protein